MLFQSLPFVGFLAVVLAAYWPLRRQLRAQNVVVAVASLVFLGWNGWQLIVPLLASAAIAYAGGLAVGRTNEAAARAGNDDPPRWPLATAVTLEIALLAWYKYQGFFAGALGTAWPFGAVRLALPLGISFYSFRAISYLIDVGRGSIEAQRSPVNVVAHVAFFPYLLAGPVEKSKAFIPQLHVERTVTSADLLEAFHLILWGLFKKIVIADALSSYVDYVFVNYRDLTGSALFIGLVYYSLQIYADFSGYSDMAVGIAKLFGFSITQNFATPYFARNIAEFWRRWHISLYNWLNDYLFTPLSIGLRDFDKSGLVAAVVLTFAVSGVWHGAAWTFVIWGLLHGLYFVPSILKPKRRRVIVSGGLAASDATVKDLPAILGTLACVMLANVFFRSDSVSAALAYLRGLASPTLVAAPNFALGHLAWVFVLPAFEWIQRRRRYALDVAEWHYTARFPLYGVIALAIFASIRFTDAKAYLYFKF